MCATLDEVMEHAEAVVVANRNDEFQRVLENPRPGQRILDLVRLTDTPPAHEGYDGICW